MDRNIREFRRLRRRLDMLERGIYDNDVMIRLTRGGREPDREQAIENYYFENAERQEEIDEIRFVLDHLSQPHAGEWSTTLKMALVVFITVVFLIAALAVVRAF
jgi:preprotein translocase subunit Sss1